MSTELIVALLSLLGTALGSTFGILTSARLTNHRIEQLEKKVEKHNNVIERMQVVEEKVKVANNRIKDLEEK